MMPILFLSWMVNLYSTRITMNVIAEQEIGIDTLHRILDECIESNLLDVAHVLWNWRRWTQGYITMASTDETKEQSLCGCTHFKNIVSIDRASLSIFIVRWAGYLAAGFTFVLKLVSVCYVDTWSDTHHSTAAFSSSLDDVSSSMISSQTSSDNANDWRCRRYDILLDGTIFFVRPTRSALILLGQIFIFVQNVPHIIVVWKITSTNAVLGVFVNECWRKEHRGMAIAIVSFFGFLDFWIWDLIGILFSHEC